MKLFTITVLAIVTAAVPAAAQDMDSSPAQQAPAAKSAIAVQSPPSVRPSNKALKAIVDLQTTVKKNDFANLPVAVAAAQAVATTKEDRYLIGRLQLDAALAAKDDSAMAAAINSLAASGYLDAVKSADLFRGLGGTLLNDKHYAEAVAAYRKALSLNPADIEAQRLLGVASFAGNQKADAAAAFQRALQLSASAGQKPTEETFRLAVQSAFDSNLPDAVDLARQWAIAYPSADSWRNSIAVYRNLMHPDVEGTLDLLRLMQATGAMTDPGDYGLYARAAAEQNNFNEAQAVLDAGLAANVINPAKPEFADLVNGLKSKPKASAADLAAATQSAQTGISLVHIGDRYAAMGNYAKAIELYRLGLAKPGTDVAVANLHLGMALARSGDKAGAITALNAVTGPRAEIAKYWLIYVNQRA